MTKQSIKLKMPDLGSSANASITEPKYNLDDIDASIMNASAYPYRWEYIKVPKKKEEGHQQLLPSV
mgnify:CR=1 FL=1